MNACDAFVENGAVHAALWPVIETWRLAAQTLANDSSIQVTWLSFLKDLGFDLQSKDYRIQQLDQFLDQAEASLANWKTTYGL